MTKSLNPRQIAVAPSSSFVQRLNPRAKAYHQHKRHPGGQAGLGAHQMDVAPTVDDIVPTRVRAVVQERW
ncbi:hypothetical protein BIW11_02519 [Tropilaelaps mercedesae]|uniref:Uncharacterized protein n=1 Tax=Tropilaelaps mercedesae TaxID=418985 RepID=A0A1V9Y1W4_9ACAR|nr:hypothetical protein BIW11_02519 [Tropilaelaps mercedesae]